MTEERFEQDELELKAKDDDVEAHRRVRADNEEPAADEESDDVEAHSKRMTHRNA
jgi:hypothetical protein